jgi:hypothetical protein
MILRSFFPRATDHQSGVAEKQSRKGPKTEIVLLLVPLGFCGADNSSMTKKNKLANTIAYLNYEYLSVVAKLCGEPVGSLIDRMAERAAAEKKAPSQKKSIASRPVKSVRAKSARAA